VKRPDPLASDILPIAGAPSSMKHVLPAAMAAVSDCGMRMTVGSGAARRLTPRRCAHPAEVGGIGLIGVGGLLHIAAAGVDTDDVPLDGVELVRPSASVRCASRLPDRGARL